MYAGHYAPAFALKRLVPEAPLWALFLGVQAVDILFFALVPLGVERMSLAAQRGPLALQLEFMPYSHSALAAALYGLAVAGVGWLAGRPRVGVAVGAAVASHWAMDLVVHTPDLHLALGEPRVGLGLWTWPGLALGFEVLVLLAGAVWLGRVVAYGRRVAVLTGLLVVAQLGFALTVPPDSVPLLAVVSQAGFFLWAGVAAWAERQSSR